MKTASTVRRSNQEWLDALRGPDPDEALSDLRAVLVRGLGYALASYSNVRDSDLEDFAQDALLKILAALDTFRGESMLTTWAQKIAVRVALTELRRRRWRDVSLDKLTGFPDSDFVPDTLADPATGPEQQVIQQMLMSSLGRLINEELTERQRQAMIAVRIHGMPLEEVARRMDTNRNALYKLLHDARQRLKKRMVADGMSSEDFLSAFQAQ
ncbi:MAG: sigma-70 family RNA polymerase sigma factor [Chloroflexi bacterium]|nr:sigma-70 family RNA polymerase sigma factor [Chloroflexota bacterium]